MEFNEALENIKIILANIGSSIDVSAYDGVIVKRLESSNTLDANRTTKQSHIAITGAQMDMFPYVRADGYFEVEYDEEDPNLKKYFVAQIPAHLHKENVDYLGEDFSLDSTEELVHISIVRSRRKDAADQIQMSMTYMDSPKYVSFRRSVHAGSYMVMLKRAKQLMYDLYAVKPGDITFNGVSLETMNNGFFKSATNTVVRLDEILVNQPLEETADDANEYERAAKVLTDFISESGFENPITSENVESVRNTFVERYNPERLAAIPDSELLDAMYYTEGDNSDSLCCFIEMNKECRSIFGSIAGGSAYKFGLFKKKETGEWTSGSPIKPIVLSDAEALERGKEIRDALVKGVQIIKEATLDSLEAYEQLDDDLRAGVGEQFYNWTWFHKYFAIICSDKLSCYHNSEWQNHVLYCFGIKPSSKYYARSGQIAMIENYAGLYYRQFFAAHVERFGRPITFFRIGTSGEDKNYAPEWIKRKVVGIGWNGLGSLKEYETADSLGKDDITDKLVELYYEDDRRTASRKAGELVRFYSTDDASVLVAADGERLLGLVDELGGYFYDASAGMAHLKPGKWHTVFGEEEKMPNKAEGLQTSCVQIKDEENLMFLYKKYYYGEDQDIVEEEDVMEEEQKLKTCLEVDREPRENALYPMNFIIYGAPGTGKTYSTAAYAIGIITGKTFEEVKAEYAGDRKRLMADYKKLVRSGQVVFTTFHQSYGYEEFIQGLRPDTKSEKMSFKTVDGVFKRIADVALNDEENNYVIIIDEINRANISKVFGELITLIETDKRWGELNETSATLQSGDPFAVPNNLYIVGTMNSADKSISLIDAALRRRFDFIEQKPEVDLIADPKLRGVLKSLNTSLADELDSSDLLIGHSYFLGKTVQDLPTILNNSIIPLLYEYFYDNKKKVSSVLSLSVDGIEIEIIDDKMGRLSVKKPE